MTMTVSAHRSSADNRIEKIDRMVCSIEILEREKEIAKSSFDRVYNSFLTSVESHLLPSREEIRGTCKSLDNWSEIAIEKMSSLFDIYRNSRQMEKIEEMERLENDNSKGSDAAWDYLNLDKVSGSSCHSKKIQKENNSEDRNQNKNVATFACRQTTQQTNKFCVDIKHIKQQYGDVSVISAPNQNRIFPFDNNRKSVATNEVWTQLNGAETKLNCNIKTNAIALDSNGFDAYEITSVTEGNQFESKSKRPKQRWDFRSESRKRSKSRERSQSWKKSQSQNRS